VNETQEQSLTSDLVV